MKSLTMLVTVFLFLVFLTPARAEEPAKAAETAEPQTVAAPVLTDEMKVDPSFVIAVLPFSTTGDLTDMGPQIAEVINASLSEQGFSLVERAELNKVLSEIELGQSGTVSEESAAKIGHLTGANIIITGRAFIDQNILNIVGKVIGVETSQFYADKVNTPVKDSYAQASRELSDKIGHLLNQKGQDLLAKNTEPEDPVKKLSPLAAGKKLPTVSVSLRENHANQAMIDPAAETEITMILSQVGFPVIDQGSSNQKADIEITGEALSERGIRRGELISCRARVELKAVERSSGRIIAVDRETQAAADTSEQIAGKTAIQKATQSLALRLVPRIIDSTSK